MKNNFMSPKKNETYVLKEINTSLPKQIKIQSTDKNNIYVDLPNGDFTSIRRKDFINYKKI